MRVLICSSVPLNSHSAALNRLTRMRDALSTQGVEAILVGSQTGLGRPWARTETGSTLQIAYDPDVTGVRRYSRALTIAGQAAAFYRQYLADLLTEFSADGVITYVSQAQMGDAILRAAHSVNRFVIADMGERFQLSSYYLLNGVYFQQSRLCSRTLTQMDGITGISHGWCEWASDLKIPCEWIPSFADDKICFSGARASNETFTIAFIGHWIRRELPIVILRAIGLCLDRGVDIRVNVIGKVGDSPRERKAMRYLSSDVRFKERVHFTGYVTEEEKDRLLFQSDAFILLRPDSRETDRLFPTRLPEYMLTGNPVILSNVGSFKHCFQHRRDVWFVSDANRPEEVAEAVSHLAAHPEERLEIGRRGRETALREFSLEVLGERLAAFLNRVALS